MNWIKNTHSKWLSLSTAQILSLLMILGIGGCKSCGQKDGNDTAMLSILKVSPDPILGDEEFTVIIKNEADNEGNEIGLENFKLMVKFLSGGEGNEFEYKDPTSAKIIKSEINETLDKIKGNGDLIIMATETRSFGIRVVPKAGATSGEIEIKLVDGSENLIDTKKVTWNPTTTPVAAELELADIIAAGGTNFGKFTITVAQADIKPSDINVKWSSNNNATFKFAGKEASAVSTLKDLLGNDTIIKANDKSVAIIYEVLDAKSEKQAIITLSLEKGGKDLLKASANQLTWNVKDLGLVLKVAKDNAAKTITYTVNKNLGVGVEDTDKIVLHYKNKVGANKAVLKKGAKGTETKAGEIELKPSDFSGADQVKDVIDVNLDTEESVEVEFELFYNGVPVPGNKSTVTVKQDIHLSIESIVHDRNNGKVLVKVKNDGTEEAKDVKLVYKTASTVATIGGNKEGEVKNLKLAKGELDIDLGVLDLSTDKTAEFTFTLSHGTFKVDKKETFTAKDFKITLTADNYDPAKGTVEVTIKNTGANKVDAVDNLVLHYSLDNDAIFAGATRSGTKKITDLPANNGEDKETLTIDLKGKATSNLTLQLKLDGKVLVTVPTVVCEEDVQVSTTFADKDFTKTVDREVEFTVENTGVNDAAQENLQVKLIRKKGKNSTINAVNPGVNVDETKSIDADDDLEAGYDKSILTLTLDPKDDDEVEIQVQLIYRGAPVMGSERTITWNRDVQVDLENADPINLTTGALKHMLRVVNPGSDEAVANKIVLKAKLIEGTAAKIKVGATSTAVGKADFAEIYTADKAINAKDTGVDLVEFEIEPSIGPKVVYDLQLFYNGQAKTNIKRVTYAAPVSLAFEDANQVVLKGDAELHRTVTYKIKNEGEAGADLRKVSIGITNNSTAGFIKVNNVVVAHGKEVKLDDTHLQLKSDIAPGDNSAGLHLLLDPENNKEVSYSLELYYDGTKQVAAAKEVVWKNSPKFKVEAKDAKVIGPKEGIVTLEITNESGRKLDADDLTKTLLTYTEVATKKELYLGTATSTINNATLKVLGIGELDDKDTHAIPLVVKRDQNEVKTFEGIELNYETASVSGGAATFDLPVVPTITLTTTANKLIYPSGENEMLLTITPDVKVSKAIAKEIKVRVTATHGGILKLKDGTDINKMSLFDLLGGKTVDTGGEDASIEFDVKADDQFEISLEGPIELARKLNIDKKA